MVEHPATTAWEMEYFPSNSDPHLTHLSVLPRLPANPFLFNSQKNKAIP
jgi:hypothetical protein